MVQVSINGSTLQVTEGITVAAAVLGAGLRHTRTTVSGAKRAPCCMMGVCYECVMVIDGQANRRACVTYVRNGMSIETQNGTGPAIANPIHE